jgi:pimeloyl-ACP methyl ester carboxylesterase
MESGGVYAVAGLRGGGEYGERWYEAGRRERKQNSVDDFIAAAEWLAASGLAAPGRVVANGGSLSGVVAAAAVVQQPSRFGAALIDIPALDLVRYDQHTGAAAWVPELGSTASPVEFKALRALSPYHNLDPSVCYPPMLVTAGEKDDVAVPSHAYKFVAALQFAQPCAKPALLQVAWDAGHTFGASNESSAETWARQLAFVDRALERKDAAASVAARPELPEVVERGTGATTLVLIPCMSCRWQSWEPFMARNADRWRMFAVTLPGFGGTPVPALPINGDAPLWHDHAVDAVSRLLDDRDLRDVVLVGHSFGSVIAMQVAAKRPDRVSRMVNVDGGLTSPRAWFRDAMPDRLKAARALDASNASAYTDAGAWQAFNAPAPIAPDRQVEYHGWFMATPRDVVFQYWRENLLRDMDPILAGLKQPVLDVKVLSPATVSIDKAVEGYRSELRRAKAPATVQTVFLKGAGHFVMEEQPRWLEGAIAAFVDGRPVADHLVTGRAATALRGRFGHVESVGTGAVPVILMPCLGCDWRAFDQFMARNAARYRMFAVTWPGMSDTPMPKVWSSDGTPLLDNVVTALEQLIRARDLDRPIIVAHSASGPMAVKFATLHPDLTRGVVTVDATIQNRDTLGFDAAARRRWADAEMAQVLRRYDDDDAWRTLNTPAPDSLPDPARVEMYRRMWLTPPRSHVLRYWREWLHLDAGRLLGDVTVPLEAIFAIGAGEKDPAAFEAGIREDFRRNAASPSVSVSFIRPATHSIWESNPAAFDDAIARFVARVR